MNDLQITFVNRPVTSPWWSASASTLHAPNILFIPKFTLHLSALLLVLLVADSTYYIQPSDHDKYYMTGCFPQLHEITPSSGQRTTTESTKPAPPQFKTIKRFFFNPRLLLCSFYPFSAWACEYVIIQPPK